MSGGMAGTPQATSNWIGPVHDDPSAILSATEALGARIVQVRTAISRVIFGQDEVGKSFVLFPYLKPGETVSKHSPYCGITGYRLFPKAQSLEADSIGNKDYIAIVTSKEELDYNSLNSAISSSTQSTYAAKVNAALQNILIRQASFSTGANGSIYFKVNANDNKAVATVVGFDKTK